MTKEEVLQECREMMDNGADQVEIFEWVEDNTDLDPADIVQELFY
jgi:hypothetical protein